MKISWIITLLLLATVAIFSVQNASVITVRFLTWEIAMSAALVILIPTLVGVLMGVSIGYWTGRRSRQRKETMPGQPVPRTTSTPGESAESL